MHTSHDGSKHGHIPSINSLPERHLVHFPYYVELHSSHEYSKHELLLHNIPLLNNSSNKLKKINLRTFFCYLVRAFFYLFIIKIEILIK